MIGTFNSNYNYNSYSNYKTDLYYLTNNLYETIEEIWPDYPTKEDFFFNEDEY